MKKNASKIVNLIFGGFTNTLKNDGRIEIRGFGSFCVRKYGAYTGRNPMTGKKVKVGRKKLVFSRWGWS
jgi:integration host factor subunit beta